MRVVLDTGILIAALITTDTPPSLIYQAWRKKRFELVTSEWQLDEFRRVSRYSKLRRQCRSPLNTRLIEPGREELHSVRPRNRLNREPAEFRTLGSVRRNSA